MTFDGFYISILEIPHRQQLVRFFCVMYIGIVDLFRYICNVRKDKTAGSSIGEDTRFSFSEEQFDSATGYHYGLIGWMAIA